MTCRMFLLWLRLGALTAVCIFGGLFVTLAVVTAVLFAHGAAVYGTEQFLRAMFLIAAARAAAGAFLLAVAALAITQALLKAFGGARG